ncbi:hypothetical protein AYI69_g9066, partial [Smittium culicis]
MDTPASKKFAMKLGTGFQNAKVTNSTGSRYNKNTVSRMIDHIYCAGLSSRPNWCTANRYFDLSDHMPITAQWTLDTLKWENLISSDCDYYPECDSSVTWSGITDTLHDTSNNKAPRADGVPSEVWKLVMAESSPTSPLAKLIHKIINLMYDTGDIPKCLETSVVVP